MPEISLFTVAVQAEQLRSAQKSYFILITKAKNGLEFKEAEIRLNYCKQLEKSFDETISSILNAQ